MLAIAFGGLGYRMRHGRRSDTFTVPPPRYLYLQ
jgi:hypothetical protein